jgi:hypothetical protein
MITPRREMDRASGRRRMQRGFWWEENIRKI